MNSRLTRLLLATCLLTGLIVSPALADIGLQQIFADDGIPAVGQAVKTAVEAVYASTNDEESVKAQITAIMNEAAATGNGEVVRYAIVAVMMAGGSEHLELSKAAIDDSTAFTDFPKITAFTVAASQSLLTQSSEQTAMGKKESGGGGGELGGSSGESGGSDRNDELGGGDDQNPFDNGDEADIMDKDSDATPT